MSDSLKFNPILPELYISDFEISLHFYVDILGFKLEYKRDNPKFGFLSYQGSQLMIQELVSGEKNQKKWSSHLAEELIFKLKQTVSKLLSIH